jgi:hypothetical protein
VIKLVGIVTTSMTQESETSRSIAALARAEQNSSASDYRLVTRTKICAYPGPRENLVGTEFSL